MPSPILSSTYLKSLSPVSLEGAAWGSVPSWTPSYTMSTMKLSDPDHGYVCSVCGDTQGAKECCIKFSVRVRKSSFVRGEDGKVLRSISA